ncbi:hypothetical protein ABZ027_29615 [Streptomyces sp. NPDC006332]|uniref:hypothetical protein n=1 Tax=Streptomyces sp. NPDC006332 TaxID=3155456 RepID=UPI0033B96B7E
MGVLYGYYRAADDQDAGRAVVREDEEPSGTGYDQFVLKGIDPVVNLLPAESLITGRSQDAVKADPRHGHLVAMVGNGEIVSVSLTDTLRDALVSFDRTLFDAVAQGWAVSDAFSYPPDKEAVEDLTSFLRQLADLAQRATGKGHHLYCWISP